MKKLVTSGAREIKFYEILVPHVPQNLNPLTPEPQFGQKLTSP